MSYHEIILGIQARTGSIRLPNKILKSFYAGESILALLIAKLIKLGFEQQVVVLTTTEQSDDAVANLALAMKVKVFRGDKNDVLSRFRAAAQLYNAKKVIRICADNPFLDSADLLRLCSIMQAEQADYYAFYINDVPSIKTHYGLWAEGLDVITLERVYLSIQLPAEKEHVTAHFYNNTQQFVVKKIATDNVLLTHGIPVRLTLDTPQDFFWLSWLYAKMEAASGDQDYYEVMEQIMETSPELISHMVSMIEQQKK